MEIDCDTIDELNCYLLSTNTHTHTSLMALFPGLPGWAGTRKVKPVWILLKQETVSGSGISWAICTSAPRRQPCQQHTTQFFYRPDALPATQQTVSKHWRDILTTNVSEYVNSVVALHIALTRLNLTSFEFVKNCELSFQFIFVAAMWMATGCHGDRLWHHWWTELLFTEY